MLNARDREKPARDDDPDDRAPRTRARASTTPWRMRPPGNAPAGVQRDASQRSVYYDTERPIPDRQIGRICPLEGASRSQRCPPSLRATSAVPRCSSAPAVGKRALGQQPDDRGTIRRPCPLDANVHHITRVAASASTATARERLPAFLGRQATARRLLQTLEILVNDVEMPERMRDRSMNRLQNRVWKDGYPVVAPTAPHGASPRAPLFASTPDVATPSAAKSSDCHGCGRRTPRR